MQDFTIEIAKNILNENREYPINFDYLINWCGLTNKQNAVYHLLNNYIIEVDYIQLASSFNIPNSLYLRIDASKEFANTTKKEKGKEFRQTFIDAERELGIYNQVSMSKKYNEIINEHTKNITDLQSELTEIKQLVSITNHKVNNINSKSNKQELEIKIDDTNTYTSRESLNSLINQYVYVKQTKDKDGYRKAWNEVYFYFKQQTGIDLKRRVNTAKNKLGKSKITTGVEYAEQNRLIDLLYELAKEILIE